MANSTNTFEVGGFIKNGYNRYFRIEKMDNSQTVLAEYNGYGATGKVLTLGTSVFMALAKNKNYTKVRYIFSKVNNRWMERAGSMEAISAIGGTRFLVKPAKFQF